MDSSRSARRRLPKENAEHSKKEEAPDYDASSFLVLYARLAQRLFMEYISAKDMTARATIINV